MQNHPSEVRIFEDGTLVAACLELEGAVLEGKNQRRVDPAHRKAPPPVVLEAPPPTGVGVRPLSFKGAVARRLAGEGVGR